MQSELVGLSNSRWKRSKWRSGSVRGARSFSVWVELSALHTTQPYSAEVMCSLEHPCFVGQKILYLRTTVQKCAIRCVLEDLAPLNCVSGVWTPALLHLLFGLSLVFASLLFDFWTQSVIMEIRAVAAAPVLFCNWPFCFTGKTKRGSSFHQAPSPLQLKLQ
eukprot:772327-Pelagomonas_calceolata.AAC.8